MPVASSTSYAKAVQEGFPYLLLQKLELVLELVSHLLPQNFLLELLGPVLAQSGGLEADSAAEQKPIPSHHWVVCLEPLLELLGYT